MTLRNTDLIQIYGNQSNTTVPVKELKDFVSQLPFDGVQEGSVLVFRAGKWVAEAPTTTVDEP